MARQRRSGRSRSGSARQRGASGVKPYVLYCGAVVAMLTMGSAFYYQSAIEKASAIDEATLCPKSGPVAIDSILIDLTDNLAPVHVAKLEQILDRKIKEAPAGTLFTVGVVTDDRSELGAMLALCKPKSGDDVSAMNQNVRLVEARYEERFLQPMKGILQGLLEPHEAKESPIMEAIQLLVSETPGFEALGSDAGGGRILR